MKRVSAIKSLLSDCSEPELCAVLMAILNAECVTYSDRFVDAFHATFKAFDADLAAWESHSEWLAMNGRAAA